MSDGVKIYGRDEALNARETMTTEQILAAIQRAITTGEVTDEFKAFIETIKEQNKGIGIKMWLGTQDEFNALTKTESNTIYFVYTTVIKDISDGIQELYDGLLDGTIKVYAATNADKATHAVSADNVSSTINGKAISSIFESDGVTAKKATETGFTNGEEYVWTNGVSPAIPKEDAYYLVKLYDTNNTPQECGIIHVDPLRTAGLHGAGNILVGNLLSDGSAFVFNSMVFSLTNASQDNKLLINPTLMMSIGEDVYPLTKNYYNKIVFTRIK